MENIEAMLCAYIEGELGEAGRAEIEKHLRENPGNRKLIADLKATRDLIRSLPRVRAPRDIEESLGGSVERSILLNHEAVPASPATTRSSRWPQALAVAAIFLLCASLGILILNVVGPTFKPQNVQQVNTSSLPGMNRNPLRAAPATMADQDRAIALADNRAADRMVPSPVAPVQYDVDAVRQRLERSAYGGARVTNGDNRASSVVLVIHSTDPATTGDHVASFFRNHNEIVWSQVPAAAPEPAASMRAFTSPSTQPGGDSKLEDSKTIPQVAAGEQPSSTRQAPGEAETQGQMFAQARLESSMPPSAPSTASNSINNGNDEQPFPRRSSPSDSKDEALGSLPQGPPAAPTTQPIRGVYVAIRLTREQADELQQSLTSRQDVRNLEILAPAGSSPSSLEQVRELRDELDKTTVSKNLSQSQDQSNGSTETNNMPNGANKAMQSAAGQNSKPAPAAAPLFDTVIVIQLEGPLPSSQPPIVLPQVIVGRYGTTQTGIDANTGDGVGGGSGGTGTQAGLVLPQSATQPAAASFPATRP